MERLRELPQDTELGKECHDYDPDCGLQCSYNHDTYLIAMV